MNYYVEMLDYRRPEKKKGKYEKKREENKFYNLKLNKTLEKLLWDSKLGVRDYKNKTDYSLEDKAEARVLYVDPKFLQNEPGKRTLGLYEPNTHTIYIANNLSEREERFVYHHEQAHAKGIYNEEMADLYAADKVGYNLRQEHNGISYAGVEDYNSKNDYALAA